MNINWDVLPHLQNFFQLSFLFSGLEVSSSYILFARVATFLLFVAGLGWALFKVLMKLLDCVQTFLHAVGPLPKTFFLLLVLIIPLSSESLGAKWIGYILLVMCLAGLAITAAVILVLWKYGVDQALRLINTFRSRTDKGDHSETHAFVTPDNVITHSSGARTGG
jgi:hypothetical protein